MDDPVARPSRQSNAIYRIAGFLMLLAAWQVAGHFEIAGKTLPALTDVLAVGSLRWRRALLMRAALATVDSAVLGLAIGVLLGCTTAILARILPVLGPGLNRVAVVVNALPAIALGPILIVTAGRAATPILLAAIPVYFLMYVAASSGLAGASMSLQNFFAATGASRWRRLYYLDSIAALPAVVSGLKIAVTTAMIGAVVGEWFGAPNGLGIIILNAMQNFQVPLMWAAVLITAGISLCAYTMISAVERFVCRRFA